MKTFALTLCASMVLFNANCSFGQELDGDGKPEVQSGERKDGSGPKGKKHAHGARRHRGGPEMMQKLFDRFDTDGNGEISKTEAPERMQERFAKIDTDGNESLSKNELKTAFEKRQGKGKKRPGGKGKGKGKRGKQGRRGPEAGNKPDADKLFQRFDANGDGSISNDEAPERMKNRFDKIDTDGNGAISTAELKAAIDKRSQKKSGKKKGKKKQQADV